jgi:hypothetical protein
MKIIALLVVAIALATCTDHKEAQQQTAITVAARAPVANEEVALTIHRAYLFTGSAYFEKKAGTRLVAIEAHIEGGGPWFDADDIELVGDGKNSGSFPHVIGLDPTWAPVEPTVPATNIRLIYQVPKQCCRSINLLFSGQRLMKQDVPVAGV